MFCASRSGVDVEEENVVSGPLTGDKSSEIEVAGDLPKSTSSPMEVTGERVYVAAGAVVFRVVPSSAESSELLRRRSPL